MKNPWKVDQQDVPDDAGIENTFERRRIFLITFLLWGLILSSGAVLYTVGEPVDGGLQVGDVTLRLPSFVVDFGGPTKRLVLDIGPEFGVVVNSDDPGVSFVVAGDRITIV